MGALKVWLLFVILFSICTVGVWLVWERSRQNQTSTELISPSVSELLNPKANETKVCLSGFILVKGDSRYKTMDFCLMKYDAKCANATNLSQGLEPAPGSLCAGGDRKHPNGTYRNNTAGCACIGNRQVVSTASGFPITYIAESDNTPNNAKSYCQKLGWHLITNNEWMTVARNVELVRENWCDRNGANCGYPPGTDGKILANGHNDSNNEKTVGNDGGALIAGDDSQVCFGTTTDGSNKCGEKGSQKRTLMLSNKEIIWDLAGNVWQWVDVIVRKGDQPKSKSGNVFDNGWISSEFASGGQTSVITDNGGGPALGYDSFRPSNPSWNSSKGVGRIFHFSGNGGKLETQYTFIRGGNWRHGYDSGVFSVHMFPTPDKENIDDVGFRCVADLNR